MLALSVLASPACRLGTSVGEPVRFQYYSGNESLPPEHQRITIIRGAMNPAYVSISYSYRGKEGTIARILKLEGEEYQRCVRMVRETHVKVVQPSERPAGAAVTDVTLTDAEGRSVTGTPSNPAEWSRFAEEIERAARGQSAK